MSAFYRSSSGIRQFENSYRFGAGSLASRAVPLCPHCERAIELNAREGSYQCVCGFDMEAVFWCSQCDGVEVPKEGQCCESCLDDIELEYEMTFHGRVNWKATL